MGSDHGKGILMATDLRVKVDVLGARLRSARNNARLTQDVAAQSLGLSRTTLVAIEAGKRAIDSKELRKFCELYEAQEADLLTTELGSLQLDVKYRSLNTESLAAHQIAAAMKLNRLAVSAVALEGMLNQPAQRITFPVVLLTREEKIEQLAEDAALELRQRLGLGISPVQDLFGLMESDLGLRVFERDLPSEISGAFAFDQTHGGFVLLNSLHPLGRRRNTASHEIGHALLMIPGLSVHFLEDDFSQREEKFCDAFGRALLMPATAVRRKFSEYKEMFGSVTVKHILVMALYFGVSTEAMFRRLESLFMVKDGTFESLKRKGLTGKHLENIPLFVGKPIVFI